MPQLARLTLALIALALVHAGPALGGTHSGQPFPTDLLTVADKSQLTGLRVALPKPDCSVRPSDCADLDVLNELDGFNVDPRLSIPFDGAIDLSTVSSATVFIVEEDGDRIGIDKIVWTAATTTLHAQPANVLDQGATHLLVVTDGVRAANGRAIDARRFWKGLRGGEAKEYRKELRRALREAEVKRSDVVAASLFTTQSVTALLERIRRQIDAETPEPATFALGPGGSRTVFPFGDVLGLVFNRQTGTSTFSASTIPAAIPVVPGAIGSVAFGKFSSPNYETTERVIPAYPTRTGVPVALGRNDVYFNLYLPSGAKPAGGWPVAIFGHGFTDSKQGAPLAVASTMAQNGFATIAINVVGHGGGPLGTLTVLRSAGSPVTFPAGGRGIDQDTNGTIGPTEGVDAAPPATLVSNRDGLRQTVVDLMQLVRELQVGMDVDADGTRDLDPGRISYFGQSFGGIYGTTLMAVEPDVHTGVLNVPGGPIIEIARLAPGFRPLVGISLVGRTPSLFNAVPNVTLTNFNENLPLRGQPPLVDTVPGADAIQQLIDHANWAQQAGNPVAYAPYLRADSLSGVARKAVIVQFAKGDRTVPNPTTSALIRAGRLEDRATYFRHDIAFATVPGYTSTNPHTFLTSLAGAGGPIAVATQLQIATFLASNGAMTVDPDGPLPLFETPIVGPLPEGLNFVP